MSTLSGGVKLSCRGFCNTPKNTGCPFEGVLHGAFPKRYPIKTCNERSSMRGYVLKKSDRLFFFDKDNKKCQSKFQIFNFHTVKDTLLLPLRDTTVIHVPIYPPRA